MMKCAKCGYEWESRKENPRCCPRCKRHIKYDKPSCKVGESKKK